MLRSRRLWSSAVGLALLLGNPVLGQDYVLLGGDSAAVNHYPGPDGTVLTGDDVVSADITTFIGSDPNFRGAFSYGAGASFGSDPALPTGNNGISFLEGTMTIDSTVAASGGGPLVTALQTTATAFRQGLGEGTMRITAVNGGTFNTSTGALTIDLDLELVGAGGLVQNLSNVMLSGTAILTDPNVATANTYVDNVLSPRGVAAGATSLAFIRVSGTIPMTFPFVLLPTPVEIVLVGLSGVPAANQADLQVDKTVDPADPVMPGDTIVFTFTVTNNGPATATGIVVTDRLSDQLTYVGNDCSAAAPVMGLFTWNVGMLANGTMATCNVELTLNGDANFDYENGATATATTIDSDLSNNTGRTVVEDRAMGMEGLDQAPEGSIRVASDADCGVCNMGTGGSQAAADNFKVDEQTRLTEIVFYGGYSDNFAFPDDFTIQIFDDKADNAAPGTPTAPGNLIATIPGPVSRRATGNLLAGFFTEYEYRTPAAVTLERGIYWVVIYNDSSGSGSAGDWFWESGDPDAESRSVPGVASSVQIPIPPLWSVTTNFQLALRIAAVSGRSAAPLLGTAALGTLAFLLLAFGARRFRRRAPGA